MFASDDETARLLREATALKSAKDLDGAVASLCRAKQCMLVSEVTYPIDTWCRLPKYLLAAGRQAEAVAEVQWLIDDLPRRLAKEYHVDDPRVGRPRSAKVRDAETAARHPMGVLLELLDRARADAN